MRKTVAIRLSLPVGVALGIAGGGRLMTPPAEAQAHVAATPSFSAVPRASGRRISGPYEVQAGWPKIPRCRGAVSRISATGRSSELPDHLASARGQRLEDR